jgi:hypothetical protein
MERNFDRTFKLDVPSGLFGDPPSRKKTFEFPLPDGFAVKRDVAPAQHGATVIARHMERMDEERLEFSEMPNGVRILWKVSNPETFPPTGRKASITVRLVGTRESEAPAEVPLQFTAKYQAIRKRFLEDFYYAGHVAQEIEGDYIKFADQTIYMGQALIFLATEVYIKRRIGEDPAPSIATIIEILDAIDELDRTAEPLYGHTSELNGFILRDNITGPADPRLKGRFKTAGSDWQKPENAAPSGDQIFGLLYGLWFVVNLAEDASLTQRARDLSDRIYRFAQKHKFELTLPNGDNVKRGGDMRWLSSLLHGLNKRITGIDRFDDSKIQVLGIGLPLNGVASFWDNAGDQAEGWLRGEIDIPGLGKQSIHSFSAHIVLMAVAPSSIWTKAEFEETAMVVNHHFAVLTYALAHNTKPDLFHFGDIRAILERCPDSGPHSDLPAETGWQRDNRWIRSKDTDKPGKGHRAYNGVDFLMLHNLAQIVFSQ